MPAWRAAAARALVPRREEAVMWIARLLVLVSLLFAMTPGRAAASTGEPMVYISPDGSGARPSTSPWILPAADGQELVLYLDVDPRSGQSGGTMCVNALGDETCGFDVRLAMATDTARFVTFTPAEIAAPGTIVGHIDSAGTTLRVNGVDIGGMQIPAPIGTLVLDAAGANQLQVSVTGMQRVGAAGQLDAIQTQVIGELPEPGVPWQLASGLLALAALARRRARSRATRSDARAPPVGSAGATPSRRLRTRASTSRRRSCPSELAWRRSAQPRSGRGRSEKHQTAALAPRVR